MRHLIKLTVIYILLFLAFTPDIVFPVGLGFYLSPFNSGNATVDWDDIYIEKDDWPMTYWGFGFVFDTRIAKRGLFNYRLNLGYEHVKYTEESDVGYISDSYFRIKLDNTFGFGILQSRLIRLWTGPQLRLAFENFPGNYNNFVNDGYAFGAGIAAVLGINIHLNNFTSFSFDLGYRINGYTGAGASGSGFSAEYDKDASISEQELFFNLYFIFRIRDSFN
jgi:hypothetical protein